MKQTMKDFKAILTDKEERKEFIGGFVCAVAMMVLVAVVIAVAY